VQQAITTYEQAITTYEQAITTYEQPGVAVYKPAVTYGGSISAIPAGGSISYAQPGGSLTLPTAQPGSVTYGGTISAKPSGVTNQDGATTLEVKVIKADYHHHKSGDPYVIIELEGTGKTHKTSHKKNTNDPKWHEHFKFHHYDHAYDLNFVLMDHDSGKDDLLGHGKLHAHKFHHGHYHGHVKLDMKNQHSDGMVEVEVKLTQNVVQQVTQQVVKQVPQKVVEQVAKQVVEQVPKTIVEQVPKTIMEQVRTPYQVQMMQQSFVQKPRTIMETVMVPKPVQMGMQAVAGPTSLYVEVIKADYHKGSSHDPYIIIEIEGTMMRQRTSTRMNTNDPKWHEAFTFPGYQRGMPLKFVLMDEDKGRDDYMGEGRLYPHDFNHGFFDGRINLPVDAGKDHFDPDGKLWIKVNLNQQMGQVAIQGQQMVPMQVPKVIMDQVPVTVPVMETVGYQSVPSTVMDTVPGGMQTVPMGMRQGPMMPIGPMMLHVEVVKADYHHHKHDDGYVVVELEGTGMKQQTSIKKDTNDPVWHEHFAFPGYQPGMDLKFTLMDKDTKSDDDKRGKAKLHASEFIHGYFDYHVELKTDKDHHGKLWIKVKVDQPMGAQSFQQMGQQQMTRQVPRTVMNQVAIQRPKLITQEKVTMVPRTVMENVTRTIMEPVTRTVMESVERTVMQSITENVTQNVTQSVTAHVKFKDLVVEVIDADYHHHKSGDPYVIIELEGTGKTQTTTFKKNTNDPKWHEKFTFQDYPHGADLTFVLMDHDSGRDDFLGHGKLHSHKFHHGHFHGDIQLDMKHQGSDGKLKLRVHLI
jgi:Ca2+-dependent lipid-binding protein